MFLSHLQKLRESEVTVRGDGLRSKTNIFPPGITLKKGCRKVAMLFFQHHDTNWNNLTMMLMPI